MPLEWRNQLAEFGGRAGKRYSACANWLEAAGREGDPDGYNTAFSEYVLAKET